MIIHLARGRTLPVRRGAGRTVRAHSGCVWVTEENGDDIVLQAGEDLRLRHPGLAVIEAFSEAAISIH